MKSMREWVSIVIAALALLGTLYIEVSHRDTENAGRISALEAHQVDGTRQLDRMETDMRDLRADVKSLVKWAMGDKK